MVWEIQCFSSYMPPSLSGVLSCEQWKAALVSWRGRWSVGSWGRWEGWRSQAALRSGTSLVSIQPLRDQQGKVPRENSLQCHVSALWSGKGAGVWTPKEHGVTLRASWDTGHIMPSLWVENRLRIVLYLGNLETDYWGPNLCILFLHLVRMTFQVL